MSNIIKKIRVDGIDYELAGSQDLSSYAKKTEVPTKVSDLKNDLEYISSSSIISEEQLSQGLKEKLNGKEVTIDFGIGEDTVTVAIMDPNTTLTKIKTKNVKSIYLSYGDVIKREYFSGTVNLGTADFIVVNIVRESESVDAVVGITFII